tara:strand:- start:21 stop:506 length:486 start_codon:yes stop_codon:yes gene_type:complete
MAELEVAGIKFRGGKIFLIITVLSSIGGALWGGFEFYKDYENMRNKIEKYTAPDLSGFDKRIELIDQKVNMMQSEMSMILEEIELVSSVAKELKNDLKDDVRRIETIVEDVEQRVKQDSRDQDKELNELVKDIEGDMEKLEIKVDKQIKKALDNPLNALNK